MIFSQFFPIVNLARVELNRHLSLRNFFNPQFSSSQAKSIFNNPEIDDDNIGISCIFFTIKLASSGDCKGNKQSRNNQNPLIRT